MGKIQKKIRHGQLTWDCKCLAAEGNDRTRKHLLNVWSLQTFPLATPILCMISSSHPTAAVVKKAEFPCVTMQMSLLSAVTETGRHTNHLRIMTYPGSWTNTLPKIFSRHSPNLKKLKLSQSVSIKQLFNVGCSCAQSFPVSWGISHRHQWGCNVTDTPKNYLSNRRCFREGSLPDV